MVSEEGFVHRNSSDGKARGVPPVVTSDCISYRRNSSLLFLVDTQLQIDLIELLGNAATMSQLVARMKLTTLERRSLLKELALRGIHITGQRRILLETIQNSDRHLDAASLLNLARERDQGINRATVYRTLELLKKLRLIDELDLMHLNGEKHFYEVKTNIDHVRLACFQCGRIEEFTSPLFERLKAEISRQKEFHIRVTRLEVGGRCSRCCALARSCAECGEEACCKSCS